MAFDRKTWNDRLVEYPNRRLLANVSTGEEQSYDVSRDEGDISQIGDAFNATNMNDLELRIEDAIGEIEGRLDADVIEVLLGASDWTGSSAPYSQTVYNSSITESSSPYLVSLLEDGASVSDQKAYTKAFGIVSTGTAMTYDGYAVFKAYKLPATSIRVGLKGV